MVIQCNAMLSLHKEFGGRCVSTRIPRRRCLKCSFSYRTLWSGLIFTTFAWSLKVCCNLTCLVSCGCADSVLPKLLVFTSVVHAWTLTRRVVNIYHVTLYNIYVAEFGTLSLGNIQKGNIASRLCVHCQVVLLSQYRRLQNARICVYESGCQV